MLTGVVGGLIVAVPANATTDTVPRITPGPAQYDWDGAGGSVSAQDASTTPLQDFTRTIQDGATTFTYTMVGKDPFVVQAKPSTTVKTFVQPVVIHLPDGHTFDPTVADSCDPGASALTRTQQSPIFVAQTWKFGGTSVGKAQYVDATQRAGFFDQTKPTGINPNYHVKLKQVVLPKITVNVPATAAAEGTIGCGSGFLGAVEINFWDNLVQSTLLGNMASAGLTKKDLPLFLFGNVVMFDTSPANCCILGYHNARGSGATFQSYANAMYDNTGAFSGSGDISVLSHEISEWMDDPDVSNATKPWGHIGQVSGCQSNLETGDPLSGTVKPKVLNGKTYHVQELAFYSWFYHQNPSQGINGWFSNFGKFLIDADPCT